MKYDLILKNCRVADVAKMEISDTVDIAIKNGIIADIGVLACNLATRTIDCENKIASPSFIDAHVHIESSMVSPREFAKAILPHGTTTVIADPHEIVNVGGATALDEFLNMTNGAVADIFTVVPSSVPATPFDTNGAGEFLAKDMQKYVCDTRVVGLGEVMCFTEVLAGDKKILDKIALFKNKTIDGHTAGLEADKLTKYRAIGIQNDHECVTIEDAKVRIECGMNVYIREGSAVRNVEAIISGLVEYNKNAEINGAKKLPIDNFAFCTDDKHLSTIYREGHIDRNVILAVSLGLPLLDAVKMASTSPARFYNLQDRGSIEIGKIADIALLESETYPKVSMVFKRGVLACDILKNDGIATKNLQNNLQIDTARQDETDDGISVENHKLANDASKSECKNTEKYMQNSVHFKDFVAKDFEVFWKEKNTAIQLIENQLLTNAVELSREEAKKATLLATIERYGKNGNYSLCPLLGYDIKCGAVATSVSHDSHNVVVAGDNASDMACAVNRLKQIGGGYVIASGGKIEGELCLDIAGLMSSSGAEAVADKIAQLEKIAKSLGVNPNIDAFTTLSFIALPVIPCVRLLDTGLFDVLNRKFIH